MLYILVALLGLAVGSFLNVVIWRVPLGESIIRPASACPQCHTEISPKDNVPILSWLLLRGKCRTCGTPISRRYPAVELITGLAFAATLWWIGESWLLLPMLFFACLAICLSAIDIDTHKLPNRIVLPSYLVVASLFTVTAGLQGSWSSLLRALLAGVILYVFYFVLLFIYPAGIGFGDVKLAGIIGAYLGWMGWGSLVIGGFGAFVIGGIVSVIFVIRRTHGRKSGIPFGPFMFAGAYLGLIGGESLWEGYLQLMGL